MDKADDLLTEMETEMSRDAETIDVQNIPPVLGGGAGAVAPMSPVVSTDTMFFSQGTLKAQALRGLPADWREKLIEAGGKIGISGDDDIAWLLVSSVIDSAASALAAGASADALRRELERLPAAMLDGARLAGGDVAGEIKQAAKDVGGTILQAGNLAAGGMAKDLITIKKVINDSAVLGADKIKSAADGLVGKLDAAVDKKVDEGVATFASEASKAAGKAARAAAASRFAWSAGGVAFLMIVFAGAGGVIEHEYLSLTHQIAPAPFVLTASGKINCGKDPALGGEICEIR